MIIHLKKGPQFQSSKHFPDNSIVFEGTKSMSTFDNNSLKQVTLKYTTTHKCSTSKTFKSNDYLTSPSIHNDTNSDKLINTKYEVYIPLVEYK